jgi:hypothetical protein
VPKPLGELGGRTTANQPGAARRVWQVYLRVPYARAGGAVRQESAQLAGLSASIIRPAPFGRFLLGG